jgi:hypothetical protein
MLDMPADEDQSLLQNGEGSPGHGTRKGKMFGRKDAADRAKDQARKQQQEKEKREELQAKIDAAEAEGADLAPGDYQIHVSVIEVKDVLPKDLNGTADPFVEVEVLSTKKYTSTAKSTLSAVYDETLQFDKPGLSKDDLENAVISVRVKDADGSRLVSTQMIGAYDFPLGWVYGKQGHEVYRRWIALVNPDHLDQESASKLQGYLKVTVAVLGPGDKLTTHDPTADRMLETQLEEQHGGPYNVLADTVRLAPCSLLLLHSCSCLPAAPAFML